MIFEPVEGAGPLHARLAAGLRRAIRGGGLAPGAALPPSRELAADLGCSRWVVTEAYGQLVAEGLLVARTGSATRVASGPAATAATIAPDRRMMMDLSVGVTDVRTFPRTKWVEAVRTALAESAVTDLVLPAPRGVHRLRFQISNHLLSTRQALPPLADVAITHGVADGLTRVCRALAVAGHETLAVEDPGWPRWRPAARAAGLRLAPIPVDGEGIRVDRLTGARAVVVTPAHQFPTGCVLSAARRAELIAWARTADGLIIEDDYDGELLHAAGSVPVLQGSAPERVVLLGTVSKTLSPGVGLGWLVTPPGWTKAVEDANAGIPVPAAVDQIALASLIERGWYERHLRSVRRHYRQRRAAVAAAFATHLPDWHLAGANIGLHCLALPDKSDMSGGVKATRKPTARLVEAAAAREVIGADVARYCLDPANATAALVIGFGNVADTVLDAAVRGLSS